MWSPLRVSVALALAVLIAGVIPGAADAAPGPQAVMAPCGEVAPDAQCGTVDVPLDRRAPPGGRSRSPTASIPTPTPPSRRSTRSSPPRAGPATRSLQNNAFAYDEFVFAPLRDRHDLVMIDQRGVGLSNAIDCSPLQHGVRHDLYSAVSACAAFLGPSADEYGTGDVALDIDAVREALGVNRFMYYGASYSRRRRAGVRGALPGPALRRGARLAGEDRRLRPFFTPGAAAWRARSTSCAPARRAARRDHRRASDDLAWLADRLRRQPLDGTGIDAVGNAHQLHVTEGFLANRITYNDSGAFVADAELAAAATSLRPGRRRPAAAPGGG